MRLQHLHLLRISRYIENVHLRIFRPESRSQGWAGFSGQDDIGKKQVYSATDVEQDANGFLGAPHGDNTESRRSQHFAGHFAHKAFILDQQDCFPKRLFCCGFAVRLIRQLHQVNSRGACRLFSVRWLVRSLAEH